ncbi:MAG: GNAT family N-acetyltransferase [Halioglobus sp.]
MSMPEIGPFESAISTSRLSLDPMMASHAKLLFPILSDRGLYHFTGDEPPESEGALASHYRYLEGRKSPDASQLWLNWLVSLKGSDTPIGYVQATVSELHADIAWVIGSDWQGNGYATEAALAMSECLSKNGISAIRACINPNHMASQRVASNVGLSISELVSNGEDIWLSKSAHS